MIEYIKGALTDLTPALAVVEAAGVGYALNLSLSTYTKIQGQKEVKLYVHEQLTTGGRDDSFTLYGFASKQERALYRMLITVSGIGANTARMMLSSLTPTELCNAIANGDTKLIKGVKGIGLKTAQRVILDLKDKVNTSGEFDSAEIFAASDNTIKKDALLTLTTLGFAKAAVEKVLDKVLKEKPDASLETVIKLALNYL